MTRWQIDGGFGLDRLVRVPDPPAPTQPGEVQVLMSAWSLNYRDLLMARGQYDPRLPLPYVPLSDGVGRVVATSDPRFAVGDRLAATFSPTWLAGPAHPDAVRRTRGGPIPGMLAEQITLPADHWVRVPEALTDEEAATLPCAGVTAYAAAVEHGEIGAGSTVLVIGSGGVSLLTLQIARSVGARVVAVTSSPAKAARLRALGAEETWSYRDEPRWGRIVRQWSGGGVDLAVDVGGQSTIAQSIDAVRVGGTVAVIGNLGGNAEPISVLPIFMRQIRCQGVFVGSRATFEALVAHLQAHPFRPIVDTTFGYARAPDAFHAFAEREHFGKVCIAL